MKVNLGILEQNTSNHGQRYTEKVTKSSILHYISNKILVKCKCHVRVELKLFFGNWGIWVI